MLPSESPLMNCCKNKEPPSTFFSYKKGACPDQRNKRLIALEYIKAFLTFVQYQKQNAGKMRRDAEKKTWKDPSANGLAAGNKPRSGDGRLQGFFSSLGPAF